MIFEVSLEEEEEEEEEKGGKKKEQTQRVFYLSSNFEPSQTCSKPK